MYANVITGTAAAPPFHKPFRDTHIEPTMRWPNQRIVGISFILPQHDTDNYSSTQLGLFSIRF